MEKTGRGFAIKKFEDRNGHGCSLQKSSIAGEDCIWFGVDELTPSVMASDAYKYGIEVPEDATGWVEYHIPDDVYLHNRMHLTRKQVRELLPHLIKFVRTGELS